MRGGPAARPKKQHWQTYRQGSVIDQISRGQIEDDDIAAIMPGLRRERDAIKADLAAEEPVSNIIILKPRAIERFRQNIEQLAEIVQSKGDDLPPEFGTVFRELVSSVIVHPRKAGAEYRYEIKGKLSAIAGPELSAGPMVAGGRIELPTSGL
jgi:site-specific DNA recombinase